MFQIFKLCLIHQFAYNSLHGCIKSFSELIWGLWVTKECYFLLKCRWYKSIICIKKQSFVIIGMQSHYLLAMTLDKPKNVYYKRFTSSNTCKGGGTSCSFRPDPLIKHFNHSPAPLSFSAASKLLYFFQSISFSISLQWLLSFYFLISLSS